MAELRWVPVGERMPPHDLPTLLWGDALEVGVDDPLTGRLCGCHGQWVLDLFAWSDDEPCDRHRDVGGIDPRAAEHTRRMLGEVTHWLDWRPGPREEGGDG